METDKGLLSMDKHLTWQSPRVRMAFLIGTGLWAVFMAVLYALPRPPLNLERWLRQHFDAPHGDAFQSVNNLISLPLSAVLVSWAFVVVGLALWKRFDRLIIVGLAPTIAASMIAPFEDFNDPQWFTIGAVITIGCFIGMFVAGIWSLAKAARQFTRNYESTASNNSTLPQS